MAKSLISKKKHKQKTSGAHTVGNKKQKGFYTVLCEKHGMKTAKNPYHWLKVAFPRNKRERTAGCPKCRSTNKL